MGPIRRRKGVAKMRTREVREGEATRDGRGAKFGGRVRIGSGYDVDVENVRAKALALARQGQVTAAKAQKTVCRG